MHGFLIVCLLFAGRPHYHNTSWTLVCLKLGSLLCEISPPPPSQTALPIIKTPGKQQQKWVFFPGCLFSSLYPSSLVHLFLLSFFYFKAFVLFLAQFGNLEMLDFYKVVFCFILMKRFEAVGIIKLVGTSAPLPFINTWNHFHLAFILFQQEQFPALRSVSLIADTHGCMKSLINPLYTTCKAPNDK